MWQFYNYQTIIYNATHEYILVVNDDNVFPKDWDSRLEIFCQQGVVVSPNQIEPNPSMFHQFIIKDLGKTPEDFNLEAYWEFEQDQYKQAELNGSTLPFLMNKYDESTRKEQLAHEFFATKWDSRAEHHHLDNSKLLRKFKQN